MKINISYFIIFLVFICPFLLWGNPDEQLLDAIGNLDPDGVKSALESGANPNYPFVNSPPLIEICLMAMFMGDQASVTQIITFLLEAGSDPNFIAEDGTTALMYMCQTSNFDAINILLDYGANVNQISSDGSTALLCLCSSSNIKYYDESELILKFIEKGVSETINSRRNNRTALMWAIYWAGENSEVVKILMEAGAVLEEGDKDIISDIFGS
jgi:ankyrin repeat protein